MNEFLQSGIIAIIGWEIGRWIVKKYKDQNMVIPMSILKANNTITISIKKTEEEQS